jgi:hypothetical protein
MGHRKTSFTNINATGGGNRDEFHLLVSALDPREDPVACDSTNEEKREAIAILHEREGGLIPTNGGHLVERPAWAERPCVCPESRPQTPSAGTLYRL